MDAYMAVAKDAGHETANDIIAQLNARSESLAIYCYSLY
jgi:hypothetical protein